MPETTDEHQSTENVLQPGTTPEEALTLARLERRLLAVRGDVHQPGPAPAKPTFSEGFSRVSPSAQTVQGPRPR
jgi:hypothetical protein